MKMRAVIALSAVGVAVAGCLGEPVLHAQARGRKTFATVTVKRSDGFISPNPVVGDGRFVWRAAPLVLVVGYAYDVSVPAIEGRMPIEPTYDIDATFPASATPRDVQEMVRSVLAGTFALRVHTAPRTMPFFRLVVEAGGHKLARAASPRGVMPEWRGITVQQGRFAGAGVTVSQIARALAGTLKRPVIDATGIAGAFDVDVVDTATPRASFAAFIDGVPHQLGLKLEAATGTVDVLVVDGFRMP